LFGEDWAAAIPTATLIRAGHSRERIGLDAQKSADSPDETVDDDRGVIRGGVNEEAEDDVHWDEILSAHEASFERGLSGQNI
jgi:hypothetical protein